MTTSDARKRAAERDSLTPTEVEADCNAAEARAGVAGVEPGYKLREHIDLVLDAGGMTDPQHRNWTTAELIVGPIAGLLTERDALRAEVERLKEAAAKAADAQKQLRNRLMAQVDAVAGLADKWERMAGNHISPVAQVNIGKRADALRATLDDPDRVLRERDAEKWDEGHTAGAMDVTNRQIWNHPPTPNPYREGSKA